MATTHFSGPVNSAAGYEVPVVVTANLPDATAVTVGTVYMVNDNGVGDNEYCLVISTGAAWVTAVGAALS